MTYIFKGNLCSWICEECREDLSGAQVKLYRVREDQPETALATASPKNTFAILSDKQVSAKQDSLIAQTETDEDGNFQFELGDDEDYNGRAFEIDVQVEKAPGQEEPPEDVDPIQFTITTLQPRWRKTELGSMAVWEYCIPSRFWCKVLEALETWVICGRVTVCGTEKRKPLPGATVTAFDADWTQDDELGQAQTDMDGKFRIYYTRNDFEQTPFPPIDIELIGGPDVYFEVEYGGDLIIDEDQSDGRQSGRENVGNCFCAGDLCWESDVVDHPEKPHWERIENLEVPADFDSNGYAGSNKWVMHDNLDMYGNMPLRNPVTNNPLKYRFLIGEWDWPGTEDPSTLPSVAPANADLQPIPNSAVTNTKVGYIYYTDANGDTQSEPVFVNSSDLDTDGCVTLLGKSVTVDMNDGTTSTVSVNESNFIGSYRLLRFNTHYLSNPPHGHTEDLGESFAGQPVDPGDREPVRKYRVRFQVFDAGDSVNKTQNNKTLSAVVIDNSPAKFALQLEELKSNTCKKIDEQVTILYTLDHPHMNSYSIKIEDNNGIVHDAPPLPTDSFSGNLFFRGGNSGSSGDVINTASDPPCAYTVILRWNTRHHPGGRGSGRFKQVLYCISERE